MNGPGWLVPVAFTSVGAAVACALAQWVPYAAGSGIQHVEAVWRREGEIAVLWLVPAKFAGGVIAIGSGLVLGREGPTVHIGATIGVEAGHRTGLRGEDIRLLQTALGGAGLAVAFGAPLGGLLFVCEEVTRMVGPRLILLALIGTAAAVSCSQLIIGEALVFPIGDTPAPALWLMPVILVFGATAGALGAAYSGLVVRTLSLFDRLTIVPPVARAGAIGAVVGLLLAMDPLVAGDGDPVSQELLQGHSPSITLLLGYFAIRFVMGPLSYAAATPGGLFAPLLALGALWGAMVHACLAPLLHGQSAGAVAFVAVGMAALFAGVVRAPVTGLVLVIEMTGSTSLIVPMLAACFAATLTADLLGSRPVYDRLRERMLERP
ncbi:ClC family H(+)/Cl(-) exchange transporter [Streptomyces vinaceus]|uniref:ClC family H(+)/Cl(-) exchange transporter n=1 Tax=Streptomyces vinaceus TaxID=1960 RepID=UPI00382C78AC